MANTRSCVSTMEKSYFPITTAPESATCLYNRNTHKAHTGRLAPSLASHRSGRNGRKAHNIIPALKQSNQVILWNLANWHLLQILATMQGPFPELVELQLYSKDEALVDIPDSFLGGSAPRLRSFELIGIPCLGLPKLLFSATHLVQLWLSDIPHSWYISPDAMVALLSVSSSLEALCLAFKSPRYHLDGATRRPPLPKRSILPALEYFRFEGATEYLEDLVTLIDTPQLNTLRIRFFNQIDFDCPRLNQFINRTPKHRKHDKAHVQFDHRSAGVLFGVLQILIPRKQQNQRLSSVAQVCSSSFSSTVEDLYIERRLSQLVWKNDATENTLWLQLLLSFSAVKNLYLYKEFAPGIAAALQELPGTRITGVLPSLQNIFVQELEPLGAFQENIGQFVAARQLSGHPITISVWECPLSVAFTFILYHSSRARRACCYSALFASCFRLHFSEDFPVPPFFIVHCTSLRLTRPRICACTRTHDP
jgi:hypothetical protein